MLPENMNELLLKVRKPGRYVGGEWNAVRKDWTDDKVKVCLAFPDTYEIGMSHLGMKILYGILNGRDDCLCERVFSPWIDFEDILRSNKIDLFSLESKRPIKLFDVIGFSLSYELTYTNVLNILDLGDIPVRSSERREDHPLIIAGGPSVFNPEPMAEFIDAFVIGDGEDVIAEIVDVYKSWKNARRERIVLLKEIAKLKGVYVPSLYKIEYNDDRTISKFFPVVEGIPERIEKRIVKDLDSAFYPTRQIVPNIQVVHDRIAVEIMRGCPHACKFCQACVVYRPCRERSVDRIVKLAEESYKETGYEEISLLSLSSADHSHIREIIERLNILFAGKDVSVAVPSLRIEEITKDLPALISKVKKAGLTFAPESGSEALRRSINKNIDIDRLFDAALESYKKGWNRVKLYFMIGLPGETDADVASITELVYAVSDLRRKADGRQAHVAVSVNAFIPKPHSFFQFEAMDDIAALKKKRDILRNGIKSRLVELSFHSFDMGFIEAVLARGDRTVSEVIWAAWRAGCRFDGWEESFKYDFWMEAFTKTRIDPHFFVNRIRSKSEILPWSHLSHI